MVEAAKTTVLVINGKGRRQNLNSEKDGTLKANKHRMGPSLRLPVFNWNTKRQIHRTQEHQNGGNKYI